MAADKSNSRLLAGLCYVPFMLINVFAILYILVKKGDDKYAKFHALQALALFIALFIATQVVMIAVFLPTMAQQMRAMESAYGANGKDIGPGVFSSMFAAYAQMIPFMLAGLLIVIAFLIVGVLVATGRDIRVPVLSGLIGRIMK